MDRCSFANWAGPRVCDIWCLVAGTGTETNVEVWRNLGTHMIRRLHGMLQARVSKLTCSIHENSRLYDNSKKLW